MDARKLRHSLRHQIGLRELRNPVWPDEASQLDALHAGASERGDEAHLRVDRKPSRLVLQPVPGADFVERHARRVHISSVAGRSRAPTRRWTWWWRRA